MSVDTFKQSKLQYVVSLQAQGIKGDELKKRVKEWEAANQNLKGEDDAIIDPNIGETSAIDITAYKPTRYFNDDGSFNLDAFESEDGKKIAEAINNNENKEDDIKLDPNEYAVFNNDGSFNLDAFSDPSSRKAALQANLPEPDKVYDIGDVSYKMSFNDNGELVFYSKGINDDEFTSAEGNELRTAVIMDKLGIPLQDFDVNDYLLELEEAPPPPKKSKTTAYEDKEIIYGQYDKDDPLRPVSVREDNFEELFLENFGVTTEYVEGLLPVLNEKQYAQLEDKASQFYQKEGDVYQLVKPQQLDTVYLQPSSLKIKVKNIDFDFDRIKINGKKIDPEYVMELIEKDQGAFAGVETLEDYLIAHEEAGADVEIITDYENSWWKTYDDYEEYINAPGPHWQAFTEARQEINNLNLDYIPATTKKVGAPGGSRGYMDIEVPGEQPFQEYFDAAKKLLTKERERTKNKAPITREELEAQVRLLLIEEKRNEILNQRRVDFLDSLDEDKRLELVDNLFGRQVYRIKEPQSQQDRANNVPPTYQYYDQFDNNVTNLVIFGSEVMKKIESGEMDYSELIALDPDGIGYRQQEPRTGAAAEGEAAGTLDTGYLDQIKDKYFDKSGNFILSPNVNLKEIKYSEETLKKINFTQRIQNIENSTEFKAAEVSKQKIENIYVDLENLQNIINEKIKKGLDFDKDLTKYNTLLTEANNESKFVNEIVADIRTLYNNVKLDYSEYLRDIGQFFDAEEEFDFLKRNYSYMSTLFGDELGEGKAVRTTTSFLTSIVTNIATLIDFFTYNIATGRFNDPGPLSGPMLKMQADIVAWNKEIENRRKKPIEFSNAFNSAPDFFEYLTYKGIENAPFMASILFGGTPGMIAASMSSGGAWQGERYYEYLNGGREYNAGWMALLSTGYSLAEFGGGILPTVVTYRMIKNRLLSPQMQESVLDGIQSWGTKFRNSIPLYSTLILGDAAGESLITQTTQNFLDGRPIHTGMGEAAFLGAAFSTTIIGFAEGYGMTLRALMPNALNREFLDNTYMINTLQSWLETTGEGYYKTKNGFLFPKTKRSQQEIDNIKKQIEDLQARNIEILSNRKKKFRKNADITGWRLYTSAMERLANLKLKAEEIYNSEVLTKAEKDALIKPLEIEYQLIVKARNEYVEAFTSTFGLLPKADQNRLKDDAKRSLGVKGNDSPTKEQILEEAKSLHIKEKLETNYYNSIDLLNKLKDRGVKVEYAYGETNTEAIALYTKLIQARIDDPNSYVVLKSGQVVKFDNEIGKKYIADFVEAIRSGDVNGQVTTLLDKKTGKKTYDVVISQQNAIANQNSEIQFHELGHVILSELIGTDPASFEQVAQGILVYLAENDPQAYIRVSTKSKGKSPDEVFTYFLEELTSGRLNIEKAKDNNFFGILGFGLSKIGREQGKNNDFSFNFKNGEQGVIDFLISFADAYKNKSLNVEQIENIVDSDAWDLGLTKPEELEEVVVTAQKEDRVISPQAIDFLEAIDDGLMTNKGLVEILNSDLSSETERYSAAEAIVEQNFGLIKGLLGFQRRPEGVQENDVKNAVIEMIIGGPIAEWTGKTTPLFQEGDGFDIVKGEVSTYLGRLRDRQADIYERAQELGGTIRDSEVIEGDVIDDSNIERETTLKPERTGINPFSLNETLPQSPNFNPDTYLGEEGIIEYVAAEILAGNLDIENITLADIKEISEIAAKDIANKLGVPVEYITTPSSNFAGPMLTRLRLYIANNAQTLINLLPPGNTEIIEIATKGKRTKKIGGKGQGLPRNILNKFYIKGKKVNNQIQWKKRNDITIDEFIEFFKVSQGDIANAVQPRSSAMQNYKGLLKILAGLQTLDAISTVLERDIQLEEGDVETTKRKKAEIDKAKPKAQRDTALNPDDAFEISNRGTSYYGKVGAKLPKTTIIDSKGKSRIVYDLTTPELRNIISVLDDYFSKHPEKAYLFRKGMTGGSNLTFRTIAEFDKIFPQVAEAIGDLKRSKYTITGGFQSPNAINKWSLDTEQKNADALKDLFLSIQSYMKGKTPAEKKAIAAVFEQFLFDGIQDQNHPLRFLAPKSFYAIDPKTKEILVKNSDTELLTRKEYYKKFPNGNYRQYKSDFNVVTEEHTMPAVQVGRILLEAAYKGRVEGTFEKIIRPSYSQGGLRLKDDMKLGPFMDSMPKEYWDIIYKRLKKGELDFLPDGVASIIRYSINNSINPFGYNLTATNKTIGEFFVGPATSLKGLSDADFDIAYAILGKKANELITDVLLGKIDIDSAKAQFKVFQTLIADKIKVFKFLDTEFGSKVEPGTTIEEKLEILSNYEKAVVNANKLDKTVKGITVLDFDDTVGITNSQVIVKMPDGTTERISATQFALQHDNLISLGATFDFSEFNKVIGGRRGPLFNKLKKAVDKFGNKNVFILTARAPEAAPAIYEWLKSENILLLENNIVGLADGSDQAKANWIVGKAAEGYNDFYFADDVLDNVYAVEQVLQQIDVKYKVQQAKQDKTVVFDQVLNNIIEQTTGIESYKVFSPAKAQLVGEKIKGYRFYLPPSAEDFLGLLYTTLPKGAKGDAAMQFYQDNLLDPYNRGVMAIENAKVSISRDFKALKEKFPSIPVSLQTETGISVYNFDHALRVYMWTKQGEDIPGISKSDQTRLNNFVKNNPELVTFADELIKIQKGLEFPKPTNQWTSSNIAQDIIRGLNKVNRKVYLAEFIENVDIIFSEKNLNKIEAAFGTEYRKQLEASIRAMKTGQNRPMSNDSISNDWFEYMNNSVGVVMFLNTRSALLQMISNVNFINWSDNNMLEAGKAFANQQQYWADVMFLMNSPYLVDRREGLKINISESEIQDAVKGSKNKYGAAVAYLLSKGFIFTRYADSFAIATGGATFYRNRVNTYIKQGMDPKLAEEKAFEDFRQIAETSQQSSDPSKISAQQRSVAGRLILAFGNTQMQYARIQKRAIQDLINGRGDWRTHVSKIIYYGMIQNLWFNALSNGVQWLLFADEDDEFAQGDEKVARTIEGMFDSQVRGFGITGAIAVTLKDVLMEIGEQAGAKSPDYEEAVWELFNISPAVDSKVRKLRSAANTFSWNAEEMKQEGIHLDNPAYLAVAQVVSATLNIPLDEAIIKINSFRAIGSQQTAAWQKVGLFLGWSTWDLGLPYYGDLSADPPLTAEQEAELRITQLSDDTTKEEQVEILLDLGLSKKQIKDLRYEVDRVKKIIELQDGNSFIKPDNNNNNE